ncbi:transporter substrate-binding domain-containing protein [Cognatishimia sp. F0-27]|nr:transporter substrate-binding domain-containing protein [Cognatishimia sp. F0-27]MCC1494791.1 transporter substrate-binding domain-containing protein [Cognatishimia sp. F0-27]
MCLGFAVFAADRAAAQNCGYTHAVSDGETVFTIAEAIYGDPEKWTLLYYANEDLLKAQVFQVNPGDALEIPCPPGVEAVAKPEPIMRPDVELALLTGSGKAPFTDRDWPGEGMVTELVNAAFEATPNPVDYEIVWDDNWSRHLFPTLSDGTLDMGFPWVKPDCAGTPDHPHCVQFHFSDPVVEVLVLLFVRTGDGFAFDSDADVVGKRLCRPEGHFTHDLDRAGRGWLTSGAVTLERVANADACFEALMAGTVDAVSVSLFDGADAMNRLNLSDKVRPLERPLSVEGLHVVISKTHWRGTAHLYRLNAGLAALKASERYGQIVSKHLDLFWERMQGS